MNYEGNDNYGQPKSKYLESLAQLDEDKLYRECGSMIYMSAFCANNPRADWHWMADACYDECNKRGKPEIYSNAWEQQVREHT